MITCFNDFMIIYIFGNPILKQDSWPLRLLPDLKKHFPKVDFEIVDPNEDWTSGEKNPVIIDTVLGIEKVTVFDSLQNFQNQTRISPHDYDLLMDLQLLKKLGKIKEVQIIGVPEKGDEKEILEQVINVIASSK